MTLSNILQKINEVLTEWKHYGYWYFIGEGKCPTKKGHRISGGKNKNSKKKTIPKKMIRMRKSVKRT